MAILFARAENSRFLVLISAHCHPPLNQPLKALMVIVAFCSMVVAVYFVRLSLEYLIGDREWARWGSLVVIFMAYFQYILDSDSAFLYPYDLPSLAVFSVGIYLLLRRSWVWYYILFIVGTFNRETTCFLTCFMVFFEYFPSSKNCAESRGSVRRVSNAVIAMQVLIQILLWLGIRHYSAHFFSTTPHYAVLTGMFNLQKGLAPRHWASLFSSFGFLWLLYLLGFKKIPHIGLRRSAWVLVFWFAVMMCVGWIYEIRIYGELIPYMAICVVLILHESTTTIPQKAT
jgi:hypothetical protein